MVFGMGSSRNEIEVVVEGTDNASDEIASVRQSLQGLSTNALAAGAAVAGIGAAMVAATKQAANYEEKLIDVERVTDRATAAELTENLREAQEDLSQTSEELAEVAEIAGRLGIEGADNIEAFSVQVAKIAEVTELAADEAATDFAKLSTALNVPIEQIEEMSSVVNTLSQTTAATAAEITGSMRRAAPAAAQLGVKFEELAAIQATLINSGMQVERAGTRMNRAFTELSENADEVAEAVGMDAAKFRELLDTQPTKALQLYLDHLQDIESRSRRVAEATELFGSSAARAVLVLAGNQEELATATADAERQMRNATSTQREFEAATRGLNFKLRQTVGMLKELAGTMGQSNLPIAKALVDQFNANINAMEEWLETSKRVRTRLFELATGFEALNEAGGGLKDFFTLQTDEQKVTLGALQALAGGDTKRAKEILGNPKEFLQAQKGTPGFNRAVDPRLRRLTAVAGADHGTDAAEAIAKNTDKTAKILEKSPLVGGARSRCDLREHLLGPFERVPRTRRRTETLETRVSKAAAEETHKGTDPATIVQDVVREFLTGGAGETVLEVDGKELARTTRENEQRHFGGEPTP